MNRFENKPRWTVKHGRSEFNPGSRILTKPEEIVRQFRQYERYRFEPPRPKIPWYQKINWNVTAEWACWILAGLTLAMITGLLIFGPTKWRDFLWMN